MSFRIQKNETNKQKTETKLGQIKIKLCACVWYEKKMYLLVFI